MIILLFFYQPPILPVHPPFTINSLQCSIYHTIEHPAGNELSSEGPARDAPLLKEHGVVFTYSLVLISFVTF